MTPELRAKIQEQIDFLTPRHEEALKDSTPGDGKINAYYAGLAFGYATALDFLDELLEIK